MDTDQERSFSFMLNNYSDRGVTIFYQQVGQTWHLGGISPYAEEGVGSVAFPSPAGMRG